MEKTLTGEEAAWAARALKNQADLIATILQETPAKSMKKDAILEAVNAKGYAWEAHHVHASLKNLKQRGLVTQKGHFDFGLTARMS